MPQSNCPMPSDWVLSALHAGLVIPAHPLALTDEGRFDEPRQRALARYYHAAGVGGLAVAVHTTQFEIREPKHGLLRPVLELAAETATAQDRITGRRTVLIAGICGDTRQATAEATLARELGYHAGLLSLGALREADDRTLIAHCQAVAREMPLFGFYLQPAVGGRILSVSFWRQLAEIPNLVGIKIAPFNRYQTLDVVRAIAETGRQQEVALYTGNDDAILLDLLTKHAVHVGKETVQVRIVGGLLGHWACWTRRAVELLETCKQARDSGQLTPELLTLAAQVTDCNSALFDAANGFAGCIAGIHHVLHRQGLLASTRCLDPTESLSPGQAEELHRVCAAYPHLTDDDFVAEHLDDWLR